MNDDLLMDGKVPDPGFNKSVARCGFVNLPGDNSVNEKDQTKSHVWYYLDKSSPGREIGKGPFGEVQLMTLAKKHHFKLETRLRSPTRTQDKWVPAGSVLKLALIISTTETYTSTFRAPWPGNKRVNPAIRS